MKLLVFVLLAGLTMAQSPYDLLLKGGHVIDAKNHVSAVRDIAIQNGRIAEVATNVDPEKAAKVVDVSGLYVTPGLVDIHVHVYAGTGMPEVYSGGGEAFIRMDSRFALASLRLPMPAARDGATFPISKVA